MRAYIKVFLWRFFGVSSLLLNVLLLTRMATPYNPSRLFGRPKRSFGKAYTLGKKIKCYRCVKNKKVVAAAFNFLLNFSI